ncbi:MAG: hybrid sensor histidine kinase/response regulator [Chromatiales bacterium]|nr:hybrid sensor histidine kinase/response regulator [Chromatiales bacterium]
MPQQKPLVLIVDDNETNVKLVEQFLMHDGRYDYLSTTNPTAVMEICRNTPVDMVLLDIMMPEMDGYQVCAQLKAQHATRDIPVIFLTAKHDMESIIKGFNTGGVDYLIKPINGMELMARMTTHLNLRRQEQELRALNATKDRFIAIIAEDLRSPITGLRGVLQMLASKFDTLSTDQIHDYIDMAHLAADSLDSLAENLIQWSAINDGNPPLSLHQLDLHALFSSAIQRVRAENLQKEIVFELDITEGSFAYADENALMLVALNLLRNAVAFSHHGGQVYIGAEESEGRWQIRIDDQGIGIAPEEQEKLFRLDTRFTRVGTSGEKGSGMGLLLCQEIMQRIGGTISLESQPDKGTHLKLSLPSRVS